LVTSASSSEALGVNSDSLSSTAGMFWLVLQLIELVASPSEPDRWAVTI